MKTRLKLSSVAVGGCLALQTLAMPLAHADGDAVNDYSSWNATCTVLGQDLNGDLINDGNVIVGIAQAIATHYGLTGPNDGMMVENAQVQIYCPAYWPTLVREGNWARSTQPTPARSHSHPTLKRAS
jgi:hypothetical protein